MKIRTSGKNGGHFLDKFPAEDAPIHVPPDGDADSENQRQGLLWNTLPTENHAFIGQSWLGVGILEWDDSPGQFVSKTTDSIIKNCLRSSKESICYVSGILHKNTSCKVIARTRGPHGGCFSMHGLQWVMSFEKERSLFESAKILSLSTLALEPFFRTARSNRRELLFSPPKRCWKISSSSSRRSARAVDRQRETVGETLRKRSQPVHVCARIVQV